MDEVVIVVFALLAAACFAFLVMLAAYAAGFYPECVHLTYSTCNGTFHDLVTNR